MEVKVICCVILLFAITFDFSLAQVAVVPVAGGVVPAVAAAAPAYSYGYSGAYGYYGYQGYGKQTNILIQCW